MAITHPTKYVTVQRLNRFRQKYDESHPAATISECQQAAAEITFVAPANNDE